MRNSDTLTNDIDLPVSKRATQTTGKTNEHSGSGPLRSRISQRTSRTDSEQIASAPVDIAATTSGTHVAVLISAPDRFDGGPIGSGAAATIWAGMFDDSGLLPVGVADKTLNVVVTRPDDTTESFTVSTGRHGSASIPYNLSDGDRGDGTYEVAVSDPDQTDVVASTTVDVGLDVVHTTWSYGPALVDASATYAFLAHNGDDGVGGIDMTVRFVAASDGTTITESELVTDADGFATLSVTFQSPGRYYIQIDRNGTRIENDVVDAYEILGETDGPVWALGGTENVFSGYVRTAAGPLANTDVVIRAYSDSEMTTLVFKRTITTDDAGFFLISYQLPSDYTGGDLTVQTETASGAPIHLDRNSIYVDDESGTNSPTVQLTATTKETYAPGETVTINIEATDGGTPINDQQLAVYVSYEFHGPPAYATTTTTGTDGTATVSLTLPSNAPDGIFLDGEIAMEYDDDRYVTSVRPEIKMYDLGYSVPSVTPGSEATYAIAVTDRITGDAIEGLPLQLNTMNDAGETGSFGRAKLVSGSDGTAETTIQVPDTVGFRSATNSLHRYEGNNSTRYLPTSLPGTLSTTDFLIPGQETEFTVEVPEDAVLSGIVFGRTPYPGRKRFGTHLQGTNTVSLLIPEDYAEGEYFRLTLWAIDSTGTHYSDVLVQQVDGTISVSASGESGIATGGSATISITASYCDQITIRDLWTDWTLSAVSPDGATVTETVDEAGTVTIEYGSIQESVSVSLTVDLPDRYIGGDYQIHVAASNEGGGHAESTAVLSIL